LSNSKPNLPIVGAAVPLKALSEHVEWLVTNHRDLEIQDAVYVPIFDNRWEHLEGTAGLPDGITRAGWRSIAAEARALLTRHQGRVSIHGPFVGMPLISFDREIQAIVKTRLKQTLAFAEAVGATQMVLHSPWTFLGGPYMPYASTAGYQQVIGLTMSLMADIVPLAEEIGCTILFEGVFDKHPGPLLALIQAFNTDTVRMSLDTGHAHIHYLQGGPPVDQWVREAGPYLAHMHLQDGDGCADRHWAPGRGSINWYAVFDALAELPEMPRLILETRQIDEGAAWLAAQGYAR
jgi:sugar phosphate isomerase/epimerase